MNENIALTKTEKFSAFIKNNVFNFILFIGCGIYILRGLAEIETTGKTIYEILADGFLSYLLGTLINLFLGENGFASGKKSNKYLNSLKYYGDIIETITPNIEKLDAFCNIENENALRNKQKDILNREGLKYNEFINAEYDVLSHCTKKQKKAIKKARHVSIFKLTEGNLLSDSVAVNDENDDLRETINSKRKRETRRNILGKLIYGIIFGFFTLAYIKGNWGAVIWYALQVAFYLILGGIQFIKNYEYVSETYRSKIIRKTNLLYKFKNQVEKNPKLFEEMGVNDNEFGL